MTEKQLRAALRAIRERSGLTPRESGALAWAIAKSYARER